MNNKNNKTEVTACLSSSHLAVLTHGIEAFNKFMYSTLTRCRHVCINQVGVCLRMYSKQILYVMHSTYLQFYHKISVFSQFHAAWIKTILNRLPVFISQSCLNSILRLPIKISKITFLSIL